MRMAVSLPLPASFMLCPGEPAIAFPTWLKIFETYKHGGGGWGACICVDLREPNKAIVSDCYPLTHMDELLTNLWGATIFSTTDLNSAYHEGLCRSVKFHLIWLL